VKTHFFLFFVTTQLQLIQLYRPTLHQSYHHHRRRRRRHGEDRRRIFLK